MGDRTAVRPAIRAARLPGNDRLVIDLLADMLGVRTNTERAALFRIDWRTLYRLRNGATPDEGTIAAILTALPVISRRLRETAVPLPVQLPADLTFDQLFEVYEPAERAA